MKPTLRALAAPTLAGALATTMLGFSAAPAAADQWWGRDARADVRQIVFSPEPPPCGTYAESVAAQDATTDIVGLSARHEGDSVTARVHFRDLVGWHDRQLTVALDTDDGAYQVTFDRTKRRGVVGELMTAPTEAPEVEECGYYSTVHRVIPCPSLRATASTARDVVEVVLPRACLDEPRWVRVGAGGARSVGDRWRVDAWSPRGVDEAVTRGPFGPRVRHST